MAFPSASFWSRVSFTVAVNGAPFLRPGPPKLVVHPVTQRLCAFAIGRERRRVETAASTVEVLIVILSCLGRIGSGDRIHAAVRMVGIIFLGGRRDWRKANPRSASPRAGSA